MRKDVEFVGISNSPSDYNAQDGVMSHLVNIIPENGELKVVGKGKMLWEVPADYTLKYIHTVNSGEKHYIFYNDGELYYQVNPTGENGSKTFFSIGSIDYEPQITSIGNTLIAYSQQGISYFLWKSLGTVSGTGETIYSYLSLGGHLPQIGISFGLRKSDTSRWSETDYKEVWYSPTNITFTCKPTDKEFLEEENQRHIETQICAMCNKAIQTIHRYGSFVFPFFVRCAYRLFDGTTLAMHTAPILMLPSMSDGIQITSDRFIDDTTLQAWVRWLSGDLCCRISNTSDNVNLWGDVITSIDIFVSAPIYTYKQGGLDKINSSSEHYEILEKGVESYGWLMSDDVEDSGKLIKLPSTYRLTDEIEAEATYFFRPPRYSDYDIQHDAANKSLFYLLKSIPFTIDGLSDYRQMHAIDLQDDYLTTLVNKEVMTDDYDSHDYLLPNSSFVYNSRLNLANLNKRLFSGFTFVQQRPESNYTADSKGIESVVTIKTTAGDRNLYVGSENTNNLNHYYYYPNVDAKEVKILKDNKVARMELKAHQFLNGAYYLFPFWKNIINTFDSLTWTDGSLPTATDAVVPITNKIYTSEVNMPFYFPVTGINTVGLGRILGMGTTTQALSQGQFGQYPLYAFTDEGVWALQMSSAGAISSVTPVSRDVVNNANSITQTDDAILFSSDRGLMMLQGSQTMCLSDALNGAWLDPTTLRGWSQIADGINLSFGDFNSMLKDSAIIYDYARQRIMVCPPTSTVALVYSLKSRQWGQSAFGTVLNTCNSYPNSVVQIPSSGKKMMTDIVDVSQESGAKVKVLAVSRPIAFGDRNVYKTVNTMIARGDDIAVALYGSRDHHIWSLVGSSKCAYLRGIQGSPHKTYKAVLVGSLEPGQHVTGLSFDITVKDDNILR